MKKMILCATACSVVLGLSSVVRAESTESEKGKIVSLDSILLMQKSKEGQKLAQEIQGEVKKLEQAVAKSQKELADMEAGIRGKATVLSQETLQEKAEELNKTKKRLELELSSKEEDVRAKVQRKQIALREKQLAVISETFTNKGWMMLVDRNTPGVICVSDSIDKTDELLKIVDASYEAKKASPSKTIVAKATEAPEIKNQTIKTTKATSAKNNKKIKAA
jgi:Skp family chaperone for outer membrane proteins